MSPIVYIGKRGEFYSELTKLNSYSYFSTPAMPWPFRALYLQLELLSRKTSLFIVFLLSGDLMSGLAHFW